MRSIGIKEAREHFTEVVQAAARGQQVTITCRGRPVAKLSSIAGTAASRLPDLSEFRRTIVATGKPLSTVVTESRKRARY